MYRNSISGPEREHSAERWGVASPLIKAPNIDEFNAQAARLQNLLNVDIAGKPHIIGKTVASAVSIGDLHTYSAIMTDDQGRMAMKMLRPCTSLFYVVEKAIGLLEQTRFEGIMLCIGKPEFKRSLDCTSLYDANMFSFMMGRKGVVMHGVYLCGNGRFFYHDYS